MEWLNFRHLYAFWMVSRTMSFTRAAQKMNVAQSAVSDQVSQLEAYLGEKLFVRSTRTLQMTQTGTQLLSYAEMIFEQSKEINLYVRDKEIPVEFTQLRVGVVGGVSRNFVFRLLETHMESSPEIKASVTTGSFDELRGLLKKLELDVLISIELPHKKDLNELTYQKIGHSVMCLSGNKRLISSIRRGSYKKPVDIYKFRHPYEVEILEKFINPQLNIDTVLRLHTDDIPLLRFFANSESGLVVIPKVGIMEDIEAGHVAHIDLENVPEVHIYGIYSKKASHQSIVRRFLDAHQSLGL